MSQIAFARLNFVAALAALALAGSVQPGLADQKRVIVVTPPVLVAGIGGVFSRRWAKVWLPITAGIYTANGLMGEYLHARGVARKPGGWKNASYNVPMGPPIAAPGLMCMVGGMGLLASILRRERFRG